MLGEIIYLSIYLSWLTETGCFLIFFGSLTKCSPRSILIVQCFTWTGPASYLWAGASHRVPISIRQLYLPHGHCVFGDSPHCLPSFSLSTESPRAQPWGLPSRLSFSWSSALDLLDVNPRRPVRVASLCWRTSVSCVIPPAPSATDTSCLNALPVEFVSRIFLARITRWI